MSILQPTWREQFARLSASESSRCWCSLQRVRNPDRIRRVLRQKPVGKSRWQPSDWEAAMGLWELVDWEFATIERSRVGAGAEWRTPQWKLRGRRVRRGSRPPSRICRTRILSWRGARSGAAPPNADHQTRQCLNMMTALCKGLSAATRDFSGLWMQGGNVTRGWE